MEQNTPFAIALEKAIKKYQDLKGEELDLKAYDIMLLDYVDLDNMDDNYDSVYWSIPKKLISFERLKEVFSIDSKSKAEAYSLAGHFRSEHDFGFGDVTYTLDIATDLESVNHYIKIAITEGV